MQEFFFTKVDLSQSITDIVLLDFWLILLSWMFISSYTTIYFFLKKISFSNAYISVNTIFECLYLLIKYARNCWGMLGVIQNAYSGYRDALPHISSP